MEKKRLCNEAKSSGWFDTIIAYSPKDLDNEFTKKFKNILNQSRIGGYGIWRPYIIKKLNEINDGDFLIYLDAGCTITKKRKEKI
jgi:hypothetical protein